MVAQQWVVDVDEAGFENQVVRRSLEVPVLVDFWASWCGPCRILGPVLEKIVREHNGRLILAKIDSDRNQRLARQWGIKGIPAVKLFVDGQVKDEFTGSLPEAAIRQFLERAIPTPADRRASLAQQMVRNGDVERAFAVCQETLALDSGHGPTLLLLAEICLDRGGIDQARDYFSRVGRGFAESPAAIRIKGRLAFAGAQGDLESLERRVMADPDDLEARLQYGQCLIGLEQYAQGMDQFLEILRKDRKFQEEAARRAMIHAFEVLGPGHPLVSTYRSKLSAVLFS